LVGISFPSSSQLSITRGGFTQGRAMPLASVRGVRPLPWTMITSTGHAAPIFR
jgi:hypothetical protein